MKIIFNSHIPFCFTHGGGQIQIEQTKAALERIGVAVEPLRWWDPTQRGDLLHQWGRVPTSLLRMAQQKGMKVINAELLTSQGSRSPGRLALQRWGSRFIETLVPPAGEQFSWASYRLADAHIAMTSWERHLMNYLFGAPLEKIFIVPNGIDDIFLQPAPPAAARGRWLICTGTIHPRKRVLELARAAVQAGTPLWIVGKAYSAADPYAVEFYALAKQHPDLICTDSPAFEDREGLVKIYHNARGFVLLSAMETRSLAAEEAAACECPLLLSDLPWARASWGDHARYCSITQSTAQTAAALRAFYDAAPSLPRPPKPPTWVKIAEQLRGIYEQVLKSK